MIFYIGLILSALIGLSLGLLGSGGSILTVPILVYFLGVEVKEAVVMSLAVVGITSSLGALLHYRKGNVDYSKAITFGVSGMIGALVGSPLTNFVTSKSLLLIFAGLMFVVAVSMFWRRNRQEQEITHKPNIYKSVVSGFGVGVLTGFLGVGGGFLIVPTLILFGGLKIKKAVGTSLLIIAINCFAGLIGHISYEVFDYNLTALVSILALFGAIIGTLLSQKVSAQNLQKTFACMIFIVALFLVYKNF